MIIDGKAIAAAVLDGVRQEVVGLPYSPRLTVFTCDPNFETKKFLALKQKRASEVGISLQLIEFDSEVTAPEMIISITHAHAASDGIVVQLPFPARIDMNEVLSAVGTSHDVDVLTYDGVLQGPLPPVVGAIDEIARRHNISFAEKNVVVVGRGKLVGLPAALYCQASGAHLIVADKNTVDITSHLQAADIIILGAGSPGLVTAAQIKPGVVIFDAGTSEEGGMLVGDAADDVMQKAAFVTPVPGGIGPITIAVLLQNVLTLAKQHRENGENVV